MNGSLTGIGGLSGSLSAAYLTGKLTAGEILAGTLTAQGILSGSLTGEEALSGRLTVPTYIGTVYDGDYEFTPTTETQTVSTSNKVLTDDITINPIPSNYGLITWNGSYLTVS